MKEFETHYGEYSNLRELVAFILTRNYSPGIWRGLVYGLLAGTA